MTWDRTVYHRGAHYNTYCATIRFMILTWALLVCLTLFTQTLKYICCKSLRYTLFEASAAKCMKTALFWVVTQRVAIIYYRRFGDFGFWPLEMGPIGCPETSVRNYHYSLRNNPEERSFYTNTVSDWFLYRPSKRNHLHYTGCPAWNVPHFGRMFLTLKYTDITQNTYIRSWTVTEIMARKVWKYDSSYTLTDYQIHIKTTRNI